jgi:conjugal transfer pilus assembly protein TraF
MLKLAFLINLAVLTVSVAHANDPSYYSDQGEHGYYHYEDPEFKEPVKPEQREENKKSREKPKKERRIPSLKDYTAQELWEMYPDDIAELEEDFRKKAVQFPTRENVWENLYVKDLARRKAVAYTNSYMLALQENPELNLERALPKVPAVQAIHDKAGEEERHNKIAVSRDDFAIIYFASNNCPYCVEQDKILSYFKGRNNWTIKKIEKEESPELAARFNVTMTPTLLLIRKGREDYIPITSGIIALSELENRVFMGIRFLNKETSPDNFTTTDIEKGGPLDTSGPLPFR